MAPQMVHPDPAQALAKVRSVPRGRVPIFLVGDGADEPRLAGLADGFFVRPVSPDELLARAREVLSAAAQGETGGNGARRRPKTHDGLGRARPDDTSQEFALGGHTPRGGPHLARPAAGLKPLKARPAAGPPKLPAGSRPASDANSLLAQLERRHRCAARRGAVQRRSGGAAHRHSAAGRARVRRHTDRRSAAASVGPIGRRSPRGGCWPATRWSRRAITSRCSGVVARRDGRGGAEGAR